MIDDDDYLLIWSLIGSFTLALVFFGVVAFVYCFITNSNSYSLYDLITWTIGVPAFLTLTAAFGICWVQGKSLVRKKRSLSLVLIRDAPHIVALVLLGLAGNASLWLFFGKPLHLVLVQCAWCLACGVGLALFLSWLDF